MPDAAQNDAYLTSASPPAPTDDAPTDAAKMLADLELKLFGPDPVLVRGKVERGSGSLYQQLSPADRAHFDAVEKLVEAEAKVAHAETALGVAQNKLADEQKAVEAAAEHAEQAREKAEKAEAAKQHA